MLTFMSVKKKNGRYSYYFLFFVMITILLETYYNIEQRDKHDFEI